MEIFLKTIRFKDLQEQDVETNQSVGENLNYPLSEAEIPAGLYVELEEEEKNYYDEYEEHLGI
ncbi:MULTISPECIES: hypothetical protein [unclassified Myroides]|uniref:hypothetical protein n=1 Tax=unclassified Myroides TaxID=2642485 RepID=UPI0015FB9FD2|nr:MULTISPECIES: hypothetical protein [unclassified Myroides]MBB1150122.1 hypothetical protein [Myroides sp. NP-2]MDM1408355.1 hypothetical protein [Myroides sp. DF42-4-2]